jgi:hypothetical protein
VYRMVTDALDRLSLPLRVTLHVTTIPCAYTNSYAARQGVDCRAGVSTARRGAGGWGTSSTEASTHG